MNKKIVAADDKTNIALIGMPGSGKTTIGRALAKMIGYNFLDCDDYIEETEGRTLQEIINKKGDEGFNEIEEKRILELDLKNHVIAPGGSVIYSDRAMKHLKQSSVVVFLNVPYTDIESRLDDAWARRIVDIKTKGLQGLFDERVPLYKKYADVVIDCSGKPVDAIVKEIIQKLPRKDI